VTAVLIMAEAAFDQAMNAVRGALADEMINKFNEKIQEAAAAGRFKAAVDTDIGGHKLPTETINIVKERLKDAGYNTMITECSIVAAWKRPVPSEVL